MAAGSGGVGLDVHLPDASELFESAMEWLRQHYDNYRFFVERDIVWTVQTRLNKDIESRKLPFRVFHEYTIRRNRADLVIFCNGVLEVAAEFKYEPDHSRNADLGGDIPPTKFPVVDWLEAEKDVQKAREYTALNHSKAAFSVLIDEGNYFRHQHDDAPSGSKWICWTDTMSILWSRW